MKAVDLYVTSELKRLQIPGLSLGLLHQGKVLLTKGYGFAHIERSIPASPETVYRLASLTKSFTAVGIMLLVEAAKIRLDDLISHYLPHSSPPWNSITVRHLLTHTSGLENWEDLPPDLPIAEPLAAETPEAISRFMSQFPLRFPPGERWDYLPMAQRSTTDWVGTWGAAVGTRRWGTAGEGSAFRPVSCAI